MHLNHLLLAYLLAEHASGHTLESRQAIKTTGLYTAGYTTDAGLSNHTIYAPKNAPADLKLPIIVWGNGACAISGTAFEGFLTEIASYGFVIFANGPPTGGGSGRTTVQWMKNALDFVTARAGSGAYAAADLTKVAAAGMSCGGIEAMDMSDDPRVGHIGVFNSGYREAPEKAANITKPIFFFLGGESDIAYVNGERDYKSLPAGTPSWKGNLPVGHGGTYSQANGGKFGVAAVNWLQWVLKGNKTAAEWFTSSAPAADGWTVEHKDLDKINV